MLKVERNTIQNIIDRLKEADCGCSHAGNTSIQDVEGIENVSRIYIDTWLIGPLKLLLSNELSDKKVAESMSQH